MSLSVNTVGCNCLLNFLKKGHAPAVVWTCLIVSEIKNTLTLSSIDMFQFKLIEKYITNTLFQVAAHSEMSAKLQ